MIKLGVEKFSSFAECLSLYFWQLWFLLQTTITTWLDLVLLGSFPLGLAHILFPWSWSVLTSGSLLEL